MVHYAPFHVYFAFDSGGINGLEAGFFKGNYFSKMASFSKLRLDYADVLKATIRKANMPFADGVSGYFRECLQWRHMAHILILVVQEAMHIMC